MFKRAVFFTFQWLANLLVVILLLSTLLLGVMATPYGAHSVQASGLTNDSTKAGQVKTLNEDGVLTLTTETNPGGASPSAVTGRTIFNNWDIQPPTGFSKNIGNWITSVMTFIMIICSLLVLGFLIWGALNWITSGGDKGKVDQARQKMIAAVVGLIIVAASYAILMLVLAFLGFESVEELFASIKPLDGGDAQRVTRFDTNATPQPSATPIYSDNLEELL